MKQQEFDKYIDVYTFSDRIKRLVWNTVWALFFRPFALPVFNSYRRFVLKLFGARMDKGSKVYASARIWAPWNLEMGERSCIGPDAIIYNAGHVRIGKKVVISQYAYLCTATHDYTSYHNTLYWKDIEIDDYAWIAARAFVGPGVHVGERAIIGACAVQTKDAVPYGIYGGNPSKYLKKRVMRDE